MESKIDFKGKQYALTNDFSKLIVASLSSWIEELNGYWRDERGVDWSKLSYTLHTNPDYKESKEMNSNKLADEIMEKGKNAVYTKERFDAGILPEIGMKCLFKYNGLDIIGIALAMTKEFVIFNDLTGKERVRKLNECTIKPIDQRTDSEKAIDDMAEQLKNEGIVGYDKIMLNILVSKFKAGKVRGVSFTGDKK